MFLGAYHFDGHPADLLPGYRRLMEGFPQDSSDLHVCVERVDGITVFDACPSSDVFAAFSVAPEFRMAIEHAGLPTPRIEPLGEVRTARLRAGIEP